MLGLLAFLLGLLGPLVVFLVSPRLSPSPRTILWMVAVPLFCLGVNLFLRRFGDGFLVPLCVGVAGAMVLALGYGRRRL